jgi:hypothetical protein
MSSAMLLLITSWLFPFFKGMFAPFPRRGGFFRWFARYQRSSAVIVKERSLPEQVN